MMDAERINVYEACDRAIQLMNRYNLEMFGRLKGQRFDELHIIRTVTELYRKSAKKARQQYYEIGFEAFLMIGLALCDISGSEAHRMAEKAITRDWVDDMLDRVDPVTMYRFDTETERKAYRLAEILEVTPDMAREIDNALKQWSKQLGQYAINFTDYAMIEAYRAAGVEEAEWVSRKDHIVCGKCREYDGQVFKLDEIPKKHLNCRCWLIPR